MTGMQEPSGYFGPMLMLFKEHCDCFELAGKMPVLDTRKLVQRQKEKVLQKEIDALLGWLAWYNCKMMQCLRARRMGEGFCGNLDMLDRQAKEKLARLKTLMGKWGTT